MFKNFLKTMLATLSAGTPVLALSQDYLDVNRSKDGKNLTVFLENYHLLYDHSEKLIEIRNQFQNEQQAIARAISKSAFLTQEQAALVPCDFLIEIQIDRNQISDVYNRFAMDQLRELGRALKNQSRTILSLKFKKLQRGKSMRISLVHQSQRRKQLAQHGFLSRTYKHFFKPQMFSSQEFLLFYQNKLEDRNFQELCQSARYRNVNIKASAESIGPLNNLDNTVLFLYSNSCHSCKRLTPYLQTFASKYKIVRMNSHRNSHPDLPYFPFTPVLLYIKKGGLFLYNTGTMKKQVLQAFLDNPGRLTLLDDSVLQNLSGKQLSPFECIQIS